MLEDLRKRCDVVEECYEFMLAYAAQGLATDSGAGPGSQLRHLMGQAVEALSGMPEAYEAAIAQEGLQPVEKHQALLKVLEQDCRAALAGMELVLGQPVISSQLVDNLNASIHLRALLTDLFLIDEVAKLAQLRAGQEVPSDG